MNTIVFAIVSVSALGLICGSILAIASRFMYVKIDERITLLTNIMPGANCGACGYPGCSGYAAALVSEDNVKANLCAPGGAEVLKKISDILGIEAGGIVKKIAVVSCVGDCNARQKKMEYVGLQSCEAAKPVFGGEGACPYGCLGYGDCQTVCPVSAICIEDGLAHVKKDLCTGCGLCAKACPKNLISIEDSRNTVFVLCKNLEKGVVTRKKCSRGCIGCGRCARECPSKAITVTENLAVIDHEKCTSCGYCVEVCTTKCIRR